MDHALENIDRAFGAGSFGFNLNALLDHVSRCLRHVLTIAADMRAEFLGDLIAALVLILGGVLVATGILPLGFDEVFSGCVLLREASVHVVRGAAGVRLQV